MDINGPTAKKRIKEIEECTEQLTAELHREPLDEEISAETGIVLEDVRFYKRFKVDDSEVNQNFQVRFRLTAKNNELEKAREKLGLLQKDVARMAGMGHITYCAIECLRRYPNKETQKAIAGVLQEPVSRLFPKWLEMFTDKWGKTEKSRVVSIDDFSLDDPKSLKLESGIDLEEHGESIVKLQAINSAMENLSEREKGIINYRFLDGATLEETAQQFCVTRERIRQIETKAIEKIRDNKKVKHILKNTL